MHRRLECWMRNYMRRFRQRQGRAGAVMPGCVLRRYMTTRMHSAAEYTDGYPTNCEIEHRSEEQSEKGHPDHAVKYRMSQRMTHLRARALGDKQWQHTKDASERSHQDRTQAQSRSRNGRVVVIRPVLFLLFREFHNQHGVLG